MTFYQILEVPPGASATDIRRAYRRLVLLTHPDRTPDPAAHQRYLAINEAYDVLSDASRRQAYDLRLASPVSYGPLPTPRRRPAAPRRHRTVEEVRLGVHAQVYLRYTKLAQRINYVIIGFCLLLALDYAVALDYPSEPILSAEYRPERDRYGSVLREYYAYETPHTSLRALYAYPAGEVMVLRITPLFRQVLTFRRVADSPEYDYNNREHTIYGAVGWLFVALRIIAVVGAWPGRVARRQVECAVTASVLFIILIWVAFRL
ncbi:J domain-containing protein [Hymenobacter sp. ASUV-10]|uniref:J domain-containing protein n=1 Tax=Hymenobacter aranciens TaxID=3063996 RepID=A0ABT9BB79_9BACT|nr:J domain-containing protein [Hymenobacter sp. ASUV-10]MDO7874944.1 J domain-containing protein [Hymenobacter sp. ASUV-10]